VADFTRPTFTPNGWEVTGADINLQLGPGGDRRAGFTKDDFAKYLNFGPLDIRGMGGPHGRVFRWYAGTMGWA